MNEAGASADRRARPTSGARGFAASSAGIAAAGARLEQLIDACSADCARLVEALDRLPACATVDPFGSVPAVEAGAAAAGDAAAARRASRRAPAPLTASARPLRPTSLSRAQPVAAQAQHAAAASGGPGAGQRAERPQPPRAVAAGNPLPGLAGTLTGMSALSGALVGALVERFPLPPQPARDTTGAGPCATAPGGAPAGASSLAAALAGRPADPRAHTSTSGIVRELAGAPATPQGATSMLGAAGAATLQALAGPDRSRPRPGAAPASRLAQAGALLADMLAGLTQAPANRRGRASPSPGRAAPAPRAESRLVPPATAGTPAAKPAEAPAAPESDRIEDAGAGDELARQLNLLLLDQAWLRGVDLS